MLSSPPKYEQSVGENVSETKVQNDLSRGVAETTPYSAAEAPGGPRETLASPGDAGVSGPSDLSGFVECADDPAPVPVNAGHEIYCGCALCRPLAVDDDTCTGCGETCDEEFCFCPPTCAVCEDSLEDSLDFALEQFTFTAEPSDLSPGDFMECFSPDTYCAFWDEGVVIVGDTQSEAKWRVMYCEAQTRGSSRQYYTWFCDRIGVTNPCDEEFMKAISS